MIRNLRYLLLGLFITVAFFTPADAKAASPYTYAFIGDSRFVGMQQTVDTDENIIWIAKNSAGQSWYWENRDMIASLDRDTVIIYELGINDFDAGGVIGALQDLENLGFKHIYYTSVTPVDEIKASLYGYTVTNQAIEEFNNTIFMNLPYNVAMMDGYQYLSAMGVDTVDGVHYTSWTYAIWLYNILHSL